MKKLLVSLVLVGLVLSSGCVSALNHKRVQQNIVKERIMTSGTAEQKRAVASGIKPTTVLSVIPTVDGKGAFVALDLLNLSALPNFAETFSDAPVSTIGAIVVDAALVGLAGYAIQQATQGNSDTKGDTSVDLSNSNGNNVNINSGDGTQNVNTETRTETP